MSKKNIPLLLRPPSLAAYVLVLIGILLIGWWWLNRQLTPVSANTTTQVFVVQKGQSIDSIGQKLTEAGLIRIPFAFKYIVARKQLAKKIQAGSFRLSPNMPIEQIATTLTSGSLDTWVTLLEGWRREEMATEIKKVMEQAGATFDEQLFIKLTQGKEGYLYPDTYLIPVGASEEKIVSLLQNTFDQKVTQALAPDLKASGRSLEDVITMASLVEREARSETARAMVAGILWKRLEAGWPLQVDATLQYAKGYDQNDKTWWTPPTYLDKNLTSAYNTYQNPGLPPGPIASPSLSAIKATLNPTPSEYWFYLTGNDNQMHYAETAEAHAENIQKYL